MDLEIVVLQFGMPTHRSVIEFTGVLPEGEVHVIGEDYK